MNNLGKFSYEIVVKEIKQALDDYLLNPYTLKEAYLHSIISPKLNYLTLVLGSYDITKCLNPLDFDPRTTFTFNNSNDIDETRLIKISKTSTVMFRNRKKRILLFSNECTPEPTIEHFYDLIRLARKLRNKSVLIALSLAGSGASKPQHFHAHIMQPKYGCYGNNKKSIDIKNLFTINVADISYLDNSAEKMVCSKVIVQEIFKPIWGLRFDFSLEKQTSQDMAQKLFKAIHYGVRYCSQLNLTYNMFLHSSCPDIVIVLFRLPQHECPFAHPDVIKMMESQFGSNTVNILSKSPNINWRWGWGELIGWLKPVSPTESLSQLPYDFWRSIYDTISLPISLRPKIFSQVRLNLLK